MNNQTQFYLFTEKGITDRFSAATFTRRKPMSLSFTTDAQ